MTDDVETIEEVWTYVGQRLVRGDKLRHTWMEPDGEMRLFAKVGRGFGIGQRATVQVVRNGSDGVSIVGSPTYLDTPDDERRIEWQADDRASTAAADMLRRQKRDRTENDDFLDACGVLRDLVRKQVGSARRAGLIGAIIAEISR